MDWFEFFGWAMAAVAYTAFIHARGWNNGFREASSLFSDVPDAERRILDYERKEFLSGD